MAKVKLTKTELKAQTDALKRFQRFLPMLQLKKQQLQSEIAGISAKAEKTRAAERGVREDLNRWVGLFATDPDLLAGLVKVKSVKTGSANIAGVAIPTFESIETDVKEVDPWATPAWVDGAVDVTTNSSPPSSSRPRSVSTCSRRCGFPNARRRSASSRSRSATSRPPPSRAARSRRGGTSRDRSDEAPRPRLPRV